RRLLGPAREVRRRGAVGRDRSGHEHRGRAGAAPAPPLNAARRSDSALWLISCRSFLTARRSDSALWLISCRSFLTARRSAAPRLPEAGVVPAEGDQLVVGALLDHGALR